MKNNRNIIERLENIILVLEYPLINKQLKEKIEELLETIVDNLDQVENELSLHKEYEKVHLNENEWKIIDIIGNNKVTTKKIDENINFSPSTRSTLIKRLISKKLVNVETVHDYEKGRPYHLYSLTVQGSNIRIEDLDTESSPSFYIEKNIEVDELREEQNFNEDTNESVSLNGKENEVNPDEGDYVIKQLEWMVINLIGEGKSSLGDISHFFNLGSQKMKALLEEMIAKGLIVESKISASGRGRPALYYFLSSLGKRFFELRNQEKPLEPQMERFSKHGSPEHGRLMARTGELLESRGYKVDYDGNNTTFELSNGKSIRFDIRAFKEDSKEELFFETERLKGGGKHIYTKLDKIWELFNLNRHYNKVIFIFPNQETNRKFKRYIIRWCENNYIYRTNKKDELRDFLTIDHTTFELYKIDKIDSVYLKSK